MHSLAYYICRVFPIDRNKIIMWTFEGSGGYGCSPRYVAEEICSLKWHIWSTNMIYIPVFIYADDMEEYIADRGELRFDIYGLPFPVALNNEELVENISRFDGKKYRKRTDAFMKDVGIFENGRANERVVDLINS